MFLLAVCPKGCCLSQKDFKTDVVDCRYIDFLGPLPIFKVTEESEVSLSSLELRSAILNPFSHTS